MLGSSLLLLAGCVVLFRAQRNGSLELYGARIYSAGQRRMVDAIDRLDDAYGGDAVADGAATSDSHSAEATASSSLATRRTGSSRLKLASMVKDSKTQSVEQEDSALAGEPGRPVQSKPNRGEATATSGNINAGRPVAVSADVMKAGLISSPAVEYPAGTSQLDGHVVLQVLISKSGYVKTLQVVEGDPALRSAAIQTVSAWRYRPYLVNGEPVEVSTTVTLYFKLDY
jgi:TonB family protein